MALDPKSYQERKVYPDMRYIDDKMQQQEHESRNTPIRGPISQTRSSTKLMRQISALGMEDPIFCTTEDVPDHPSNIFADMSFNDVPTDMLDLMSIASDPTAVRGAGLDESIMDLSLTCFIEPPSSLLDSSKNGSFKGTKELYENNRFETPPQVIEDTSNSSATLRGFSISRNSGLTSSLPKHRTGIAHSNSATQRRKAIQGQQTPSLRRKDGIFEGSDQLNFKKSARPTKDAWNASIPSLDVNGIFSSSNSKLRSDGKAHNSSNCAMHDPLIVEAALALEQQQRGSSRSFIPSEMIEMAKSQHSFAAHNRNSTALKQIMSPSRERRLLPTMSGLFSP